jgi:hypothetical protein
MINWLIEYQLYNCIYEIQLEDEIVDNHCSQSIPKFYCNKTKVGEINLSFLLFLITNLHKYLCKEQEFFNRTALYMYWDPYGNKMHLCLLLCVFFSYQVKYIPPLTTTPYFLGGGRDCMVVFTTTYTINAYHH